MHSTSSAFGAAATAFGFLTCQPVPLAFDARPIRGLPDRAMPLDELRDLLVTGRYPADTTDAVWRQLATHARDWGATWTVGAVGVALPGLTRMAARLSRGYPRLADDIDGEVLTGFLHALRSADLTTPRVWLRLCWAAWRAGATVIRPQDTSDLPPEFDTGSRTPARPYGHPDLVLGRAVAAGIITARQADLIGQTRLGDVLVEQIAAEEGVSAPVVRMRRRRAELTLTRALQQGDLAVAAPRRTVRAAA